MCSLKLTQLCIWLFWSLDVQNLVYMTQNQNKEADSLTKLFQNVISFTDLFKCIFHHWLQYIIYKLRPDHGLLYAQWFESRNKLCEILRHFTCFTNFHTIFPTQMSPRSHGNNCYYCFWFFLNTSTPKDIWISRNILYSKRYLNKQKHTL